MQGVLNRISSDLLFFLWKRLRSDNKLFRKLYFKQQNFLPLSSNWFKKTAFSIRSGNFDYSKYLGCSDSFISRPGFLGVPLNNLKALVIRKAFVFVMRPYFSLGFGKFYSPIFCNVTSFNNGFYDFSLKRDFSNLSPVEWEDVTLHSVLDVIRSWDTNIKFIVSARFLRFFDFSNKNRLKNIIKRYLNESRARVRQQHPADGRQHEKNRQPPAKLSHITREKHTSFVRR